MRWNLKEILKGTRMALKKALSKRDKWMKDWPGQLCVTSSQMQWTADVTKALATAKERGDKKALKSMKKKQVRTHHWALWWSSLGWMTERGRERRKGREEKRRV